MQDKKYIFPTEQIIIFKYLHIQYFGTLQLHMTITITYFIR